MLFNADGALNWQNWTALGTLATMFATASALYFSWQALRAPLREAKRQRRESTLEVLRATRETQGLFHDARELVEASEWNDVSIGKLQAKAGLNRRALEQLIQRPSLTDGAIFTAAGAVELLELILSIELESAHVARALAAKREGGFPGAVHVNPRQPAVALIKEGDDVLKVTIERAAKVERYLKEWRIVRLGRRAIRWYRTRTANWHAASPESAQSQ